MMKRKAWISALLSAILLLTCVACSTSTGDTEITSPSTQPADVSTTPASESAEDTATSEATEETTATETEADEKLETAYVVDGYTFTDPVEILALDENGSYSSVDGLFMLTIPEELQEYLMLVRLTNESEDQNGVLAYFIPALDMYPDLTDWGTIAFEVFAVKTGSDADTLISGDTDEEPSCVSGDYTYYVLDSANDVAAVLADNYDEYKDELTAIQENVTSWVQID